MDRGDRFGSGGSGNPPPPDEAWWAEVLKEGGKGEGSPAEGQAYRRAAETGTDEDWAWAAELYARDEVISLPVIGFNRGGLLVEARSLRGFVPVSHLVDIESGADEEERQQLLATYVGDTLCLKVIEHNSARGRLVLSQRAAQSGPGERQKLLGRLQPGEVVSGTVTNITRFGVFIDLGGLEGLIHVSELSWGRVRHPEDVVSCGEQVRVKVLSIEREHCRVALSLKELLPDPWQSVAEQHHVGELVEGVITNVVRFGAFVELHEGLEGLIHISELGEGSLLHPRNAVQEGERVRARIIHLDPASRRLGLSLRLGASEGEASDSAISRDERNSAAIREESNPAALQEESEGVTSS